jgi:hypothetical protein
MGAVVEVAGTAAKVDGMNILTASKVSAKS